MKLLSKAIFAILIITALFSCRKELGKAEWDVAVMAPLIKTTLSLNNLVADSLIQVNPDNSLKLVYDNTLYSFSVDSLVNVPDTISQQSFNSPASFSHIAPGTTLLPNDTDNNHLALGSAQVTKIIIKSGFVNLQIKNTMRGKMQCTYQIPWATLGGVPFSETDLVPAGTIASPSTFTKQIDVSGYSLNLTGKNGNGCNTLTSVVRVATDPSGGYDTILTSDNLKVLTSFEGMVIGYAKGYFGSQSFQSGKKSSAFSLFKKITGGSLSLQSLHLTLNVSNGFGIDASLLINEIKSVNSRTGNVVPLVSSIVGNTINITRAQETYNISNPVAPSVYSFNLDNTNFKQLIENLPDSLEYSINITTDPLGNVSSGNDFVYNNYGFNANLDLEIPLSIIANNLTLTDTLGFNLSKPSGYTINRGALTLIADNGFPFSASAQLFLLDENNIKTDSLLVSNNIISSPQLDMNYKVISPMRSIIKIPLSGAKLNKLYSAKKMIVVARFNTAHQPKYIKIYNNYKLGMELTGDFNMTVN